MGETLAAFSFFMPGQTPEDAKCMREWISPEPARETLIKSLSDFILGFFIQSEETEGANSELFKENVDDAMYKNPYEI